MNERTNSSHALQIFESPQFGQIRTYGTSEQPLFCLSDVAKALEYANPAKAVIDHCKGVTILETPTSGGIQKMKYGTEAEVYRLVMKSNAPKAEAFQDWVCGEVLPEIRKNGGYIAAREGETEQELMARAVIVAQATIDRQKQQLQEAKQHIAIAEETIEQQERQLIEQKPKVLFAESVETSDDTVLVKELAAILTQNGYKIGQNRLFEELRERGFLCKGGSSKNQPTQRYIEMGLFEILKRDIHNPNGTSHVSTTTKVTGKGLVYFVNYFLNIKKSA